MQKLLTFWKVIILDTLGVALMILAILTGWLPGPGGIKKFIDRMPPEVGEAVDYRSLHVTAVYPEELACHGLSTIERSKLFGVERLIRAELADTDIDGTILQVDEDEPHLTAYKKFAGLSVEPNDALQTVRYASSKVIRDTLGIKIADWRGDYHVALARRHSRKPVPKREAHFPSGLLVNGLTVRTGHANVSRRPLENRFARHMARAVFSQADHKYRP